MRIAYYGVMCLFAYFAYVLHERGDTFYAAVMVLAAGVAYGATREER
jgi:hypothetical protein